MVTVTLSDKQASELASLLWECCTETEDGVKTLREDLALSATLRAVVDAIENARRESSWLRG